MNYLIQFAGREYAMYDTAVKFFIYSTEHSDYLIDLYANGRPTPFSPMSNSIYLKGSQKNAHYDLFVDFDGDMVMSNKVIHITPHTLELPENIYKYRYWAVLGTLYHIIEDVSSAYVTGYLLENKMKQELEVFSSYSSHLSFALRIAVNEIFGRDI